jgi:small subunit ribosomal protein S1
VAKGNGVETGNDTQNTEAMEQNMEKDNPDNLNENETEEDFETLLDRSMGKPVDFGPGQKVDVAVTQITKDWVFIDVGGKSDGYIVINEFMDDEGNLTIKEGDTVSAYFLSFRNHEMLFTTRLTDDTTGTEHLEEAFHSGIPLEGHVEKEIKGGFAVKIAGNIRAFCPYSQMGLHRVEDTAQYINQRMTFKIIEYGKKGRNIIISNRAILEAERQRQKEAFRESLAEGMTVSGEITSVQKFGAFVDIGGLEGLIPISEISWGRVEDINGVLSVGQRVDVAIKKLDWENDKFAFSLKAVQPDPSDNLGRKYRQGSVHKGIVSRLAPFGAFVTLEPGIDGLVHISELGKGKRINHPRDVLEEKQAVEVKIARVDEKQKRLGLELVSDDQDSEDDDYFKKHMADSKNAGSLGTLGDILRAQMKKKK